MSSSQRIAGSRRVVAARRGRRLFAALLLFGALSVGFVPTSAPADTTHPFLGDIDLQANASWPFPIGVDGDGNLIVWLEDQRTIAKFDPEGNPVDFSGLGSSVIDGVGSSTCTPGIPSDSCDRTPANTPFTSTALFDNTVAAVDSSGGPANGYIYLENNQRLNGGTGEIYIFDSAGVYKGTLDQTKVSSDNPGNEGAYGLSVSPQGVLYVFYGEHIDRWVPVDGNPAHDEFNGQVRAPCSPGLCLGHLASYKGGGAAGSNFVYGCCYDSTHGSVPNIFSKYPLSEFFRVGEFNAAISLDFSPDPGPLGGAHHDQFIGGVDPATEHVYVMSGLDVNIPGVPTISQTPGYQEWTEDNQRVGPVFGTGQVSYPWPGSIAFDRSGGATDGRIYATGQTDRQIAVFGPPVTIPDIGEVGATVAHTDADLEAKIGNAGGLDVTSCEIKYGTTVGYGTTVPCAPAASSGTPYTIDTHISASLTGLTPEQDYHFRIEAGNVNGVNISDDHVFHTQAVLGVSTDPVTDLAIDSASLNGSLNPDSVATSYHFDYGIDTQYGESTPTEPAPAGSVLAPVPPVGIGSLQRGKTYHYRLVASNTYGTSYGPDRTFLVPDSPEISSVFSTNVTGTSADLNARINPLGYASSYYIEYGTSPNYGTVLPTSNIGNGTVGQVVTSHVEGLQPGATYHFRVVATNKWGTTSSGDTTFNFAPPTCPNQQVRQQTRASYLPDCRAYELVSPPQAGAVTLLPGDTADGYFVGNPNYALAPPNASGLAQTPARFGFYGEMGAPGGFNPPNALADRYVATRTDAGWVTTYPGRTGDQTLVAARPQCSITMDRCLDYRVTSPNTINPTSGSPAPYVWDISGASLGRWPTAVPFRDQFNGYGVPSPDFSHYVFSSRNFRFTTDGVVGTAPGSAYDNETGSGAITLISKLPNGAAIPGEPANAADNTEFIKFPGVSANGSHVLMSTATAPACDLAPKKCPPSWVHLYMRVDDAVSYDVSKGHVVNYVGMTANGSKVFFTTADSLVPEDHDSSVDLYIWSEATDSLTVVAQGNGNGDTDDCHASWTSNCDVQPITPERPGADDRLSSASGDVYFYSPEQLDPSNPGIHNARNLYAYRDGRVLYVATLSSGTQVDRMQISPDGSHVGFLTRSNVTAYDSEGWEEMYTFDPATGRIRCASCIPSGAPPTISYEVPDAFHSKGFTKDVTASESGRFMSDDGRVAFTTPDALVSKDTDQTLDVYEYVEGKPQLITQGTEARVEQRGALFSPAADTGLEAISANGVDLYFSTFDTLAPQDQNGSFVKFYDARTNGGFIAPPLSMPCTAADECHGDESEPASRLQVGTGAVLSGGNIAGRHRVAQHRKKRHHRRHRKSHHRRNSGGRHG